MDIYMWHTDDFIHFIHSSKAVYQKYITVWHSVNAWGPNLYQLSIKG